MKHRILVIIFILSSYPCLGKEHPRIYVSDSDRVFITKRINEENWAREAFGKIKSEVDKYVDLHQKDSAWIISRLSMYWKEGERFTQCYLKKQNWDRGEGNAPVPTVRLPGMRTWNKYINVPLEERIPYNETGDMWGVDRTNPQLPPVLVSYKESGHMIRSNNVEILTLAEKSSFLYWITNDEKYAKFSKDIFYTWLIGTYYMNPVLDPEQSTGGPGGWVPGGMCGYYDYEQIHDDLALHAATIYDFIFYYLKDNPHTHLKKIGKSLKEIAGIVFKRFIDIGFIRGSKTGNWNVNGWNMILRPILVLDSNKNYADGKGREYYLHYLTTESTRFHDAIPDILKSYNPITGLWPESPGYSFGIISMLLEFSCMLRVSNIDIIANNPLILKAALAALPWMDSHSNMIVFGDSRGGIVDFSIFEHLLSYYTLKNDSEGIEKVATTLRESIESGIYNRSNAQWFHLCTYTSSIPVITSCKKERSSFSPHHRMITMRNNVSEKQLMFLLYGGKKGYHLSKNGLAMQLYGFGYALAPDAAAYESYWSPDFYYHQTATGCNTILPGYANGEIVINALEPRIAPDQFINSNEINPYVNFVDVTAKEKRRLMVMISTSKESGYYVDVFRSDLDCNDYLYHNLGISLSLYDKEGIRLGLSESPLGKQYTTGYNWFRRTRKVSFEGDFIAKWETDTVTPGITMYMWMIGNKGREIYQVEAPYTTLNRLLTPNGICTPPFSTPTLLIRQSQNNAWKNPFVAVFEPVKNNKRYVMSVSSYPSISIENFTGLKIEGVEKRNDYILNSINKETYHLNDDISFSGNLGIISEKANKIIMLYVGKGDFLKKGNYFIKTTQKDTYASLYKQDRIWYYSSESPVKIMIDGKKISLPKGYNKKIDL